MSEELTFTGRPLKYKTAKELQIKIDEYFAKKENRIVDTLTKSGEVVALVRAAPIHITGLCEHLGLADETLCEYQNGTQKGITDEEKALFSSSIMRAKKKCEAYAVDQCFEGQKGNKADFILKNNYRNSWNDSKVVDNTSSDGTMTPNIVINKILPKN